MMNNRKKYLFGLVFVTLIIMTLFILTTESKATELSYKFNQASNTVYRVTPGTNYDDFITQFRNQIANNNDTVELYLGENKVTSGYVKTGMSLVKNSSEVYNIAVLGDISGDGLFDQTDLSNLIRHYIEMQGNVITDESKLKSADVNNDGAINLIDISATIEGIVTHTLPSDINPSTDNPKQTYTLEIIGINYGTTTYPKTKTFSLRNTNGGKLTVLSSDESVATASINGSEIAIKPQKAGSATITILSDATDEYTSSSVTYSIGINKGQGKITLSETNLVLEEDEIRDITITSLSSEEPYFYESSGDVDYEYYPYEGILTIEGDDERAVGVLEIYVAEDERYTEARTKLYVRTVERVNILDEFGYDDDKYTIEFESTASDENVSYSDSYNSLSISCYDRGENTSTLKLKCKKRYLNIYAVRLYYKLEIDGYGDEFCGVMNCMDGISDIVGIEDNRTHIRRTEYKEDDAFKVIDKYGYIYPEITLTFDTNTTSNYESAQISIYNWEILY